MTSLSSTRTRQLSSVHRAPASTLQEYCAVLPPAARWRLGLAGPKRSSYLRGAWLLDGEYVSPVAATRREWPLGQARACLPHAADLRDSPGSGDGLPSANTQQADFGFVYHLPHETRFGSRYARKFSSTGNASIWSMSLTYRFLFPAWRGYQ
jgi:hypothetical protein